jgi:acyl-CoA thioester hydrolase
VGQAFSHRLRVRYAECDPQGVVFNAHYLAYLDTNTNELLRAALGSYQTMLDRGVDIVVVEAQLRFLAPARFEDELKLEIEVSRLGNTSLTTRHRISRDGTPVAEGMLRHVMVDPTALTKKEIPSWLRQQLDPWTVEETGEAPAEESGEASA